MKSWLAAMAVTLLSIVACSDDEDGSEQKTGVFIDGPVKGLHYASDSGAGVTNDKGEFTYRNGETVTFSVGGIVLGSAAGSDQVTPFDLFGVTPPTTERELRSLIKAQGADAFDRVINVVTFLMALDVDRDPTNGIDLGEADTTLATETMAFDVHFTDFRDDVLERFASAHPGIRVDIKPGAALNHLYASLGLSLTVHMLSVSTTDYDDDGAINRRQDYTYDAQARLVKTVSDYDGDGDEDNIYETTYDANGRVVLSVERYDDDGNGVLETRGDSRYTYDVSGAQLTAVNETSVNGTVTRRVTSTSTLDPLGRLATTVREYDEDADTTVDGWERETHTYDGLGRLVLRVLERDENGDGVWDGRGEYTTSYDLAGFMVASSARTDDDANGVVDYQTENAYARDAKGRITSQTRTQISGGTVTSRSATAQEWDERGLNVRTTRSSDNNGDGTVESRTITVRTFDDKGNRLTETVDTDTLADGSIDSRSAYTYQYDDAGNETSSIYERDSDNDGTLESRRSSTTTYDENGNATESLYQEDGDGDGTFDSAERTKSQYVPVENVPGGAFESAIEKAMLVA